MANEIIQEYLSLKTAEERLEWLIERPVDSGYLGEEQRTEAYQIKECVSGLWIAGFKDKQLFKFQAWSESLVVRGVVCTTCDLAFNKDTQELSSLRHIVLEELKLDALLSSIRKVAVFRCLEEIQKFSTSTK